MASEILKSELDLFKKVSFQGAIENSQIIQYRPITALSETSTVEFDIPISPDEYLDLQNIYLWIKGRVVQQDGTAYAADQDTRYSLINYALFTIFDQLDVTLAGTLVTQSSKTFHYQSYIEALTQSTSNSDLTYLTAAGFSSSFGVAAYDFDAIDQKLFVDVSRSKEFTLYGRFHGSIFNSDRLLLNGVPVHLTFTRANPTFYVMGRPLQVAVQAPAQPALDATEPKLQLQDISLFARKVKLSPNLLNAHAKALQMSKAIYPIKRPVIKVINLPANQSTFMLDNVITGQLPCKLIIGLVTNNAFSGSYTTNPLKFGNESVMFLCAHINGEQYPRTPYTPDYTTGSEKYEREYHDLFMNLGANKTISQPAIDLNGYSKGCCLYAFNFNSDFENANENEYINIPKDGYLNIEIRFRANILNALKLICYALFDNTIEIDENRNVTIDYA